MSESKSSRGILIVIAIAVVIIAAALVLPQVFRGATTGMEALDSAASQVSPYKPFVDAAKNDIHVGTILQELNWDGKSYKVIPWQDAHYVTVEFLYKAAGSSEDSSYKVNVYNDHPGGYIVNVQGE